MESDRARRDVLVTVADSTYLSAAKQLFTSVYLRGGWKGDYCLLTTDSSKELGWFRTRGAHVRQLPLPIDDEGWFDRGFRPWNGPTSTLKFYLFGKAFREFGRVIYLDADIIVRGSLAPLLDNHSFLACEDAGNTIAHCFSYRQRYLRDQQKTYDLKKKAFNSGVLVFSPGELPGEAYDELLALYNRHKDRSRATDQGALNLYFYGAWTRAHKRFNVLQFRSMRGYQGDVLHFAGPDKPWIRGHAFFREWTTNLTAAEKIDELSRPVGRGQKARVKEIMVFVVRHTWNELLAKTRRVLFRLALPVYSRIVKYLLSGLQKPK